MRYLSVCSGIEAASVAFHDLGWEPVAFSEIDPFPCKVLAHHYPNVPNWGDMTKYKEWKNADVDVLIGGTPCQSFSVAGLRGGLDDIRGNLMLTYSCIARKYRPRWLVWENVPGVLSSNGGRDFASFLGVMSGQHIECPASGWQSGGIVPGIESAYGLAWRVLDAQYFGVAQRRRRVFVVGYLGDWHRAAAVLSIGESLYGHPPPSRKAGQKVAPTIGTGAPYSRTGNTGSEVDAMVVAARPKVWAEETVGTLCADTHPGAYSGQDAYTGRLVAQTIAFSSNMRDPDCQTDGSTPTVKPGGHGGGNPPAVAYPIQDQATRHSGKRGDKQDGKGNGLGIGEDGDPAPTMTKGDRHAVAYPINTLTLGGRPDPANDLRMTMGIGEDGDPQFTLQAAHSHAVAFGGDIARTLSARHDSSPCVDRGMDVIFQSMAVRRLTTQEAEILQGFPVGYTDIKPNGKPTPDGPRYKALGNSFAVPVVRWIGERIQKVSEIA